MTIQDYFNPQIHTGNETVPLYPDPLTSSPMNLHIHGIHISPVGNQDNVLIELTAGYYNIYTYFIPSDMPQGLFWYHCHRHMLTESQTERGLAGLLKIGRVDGNLPIVTENKIPIRAMAL